MYEIADALKLRYQQFFDKCKKILKMTFNYLRFCLMVSLIIFSACNDDNSSSNANIDNRDIEFFDLKAFFEDEIKNFQYTSIEKTVRLNDETETQILAEFDAAKELEIFKKNNLNNPSWKDKYQVAQEPKVETYEAADDDLKIKKVTIERENNQVKKITIMTTANQRVFKAAKTLTYEPKVGYSIKNNQNVTLMGETDMEVQVKFLK